MTAQHLNMIDWMEERVDLTSPLLDDKLQTASAAAFQSGRLTPLIKEELWTKIQAKRLSEGKDEMVVNFEDKPRFRRLSKEEEDRVVMRKESNKMAARKCRMKKKTVVKNMEKTLEEEQERNNHLKSKVYALEREIGMYRKQLQLLTTISAADEDDVPPLKNEASEHLPHTSTAPSLGDGLQPLADLSTPLLTIPYFITPPSDCVPPPRSSTPFMTLPEPADCAPFAMSTTPLLEEFNVNDNDVQVVPFSFFME